MIFFGIYLIFFEIFFLIFIQGIDISPRMIWKAEHWWEIPKQANFLATEMQNFQPTEKFDVVFSFAVIYYAVPMETLQNKISQWLKPGTNIFFW